MVDGVQIVGKNEIKFFNGDYASEKVVFIGYSGTCS